MEIADWYTVGGFSGGAILASLLNIIVIPMNRILWAWFGINAILFLVAMYKIRKTNNPG